MEHTTRPSATLSVQPNTSVSSTDKLREQAATIRDDVRELGGITRDAAKETLSSARHATSEFIEEKKEQVSEYEDQLIGYVRAKPVKSLVIAAGVGALLGMVIRGR